MYINYNVYIYKCLYQLLLLLSIKCYNVIYTEDYYTNMTEIVHCTKEEI